MPIDIAAELTQWFLSAETRHEIRELVREAVRAEIRAALDEELIDTKEAAVLLNMSEAGLRKAVERGQIRCMRVGRRLRFRRSELLELRLERES